MAWKRLGATSRQYTNAILTSLNLAYKNVRVALPVDTVVLVQLIHSHYIQYARLYWTL